MRNIIIGILLIVLGAIAPTICIVKDIQFNQDCGGYLKQAADANTPEIALDRVNKALAYIEANKLTYGYTSVLWKTEDENVAFWYENIKACKSELEDCMHSSQLEKTNVLMKVRESLTDNGEEGTALTIPDGISRYPNNEAYCLFVWLSIVSIIGGIILIAIGAEFEYL